MLQRKEIQPNCDHPPVVCFGKWREDSNCSVLFDDEELDGIYTEGASSWQAAVNKLARYALRNNTILVECVAC